MSKELAIKSDIAKQHDLSVIERVVMQGDLSKLDPQQRVTYYHRVCESMGLNPYTRPFDYISLNNKLTLYAKKDATEQLRQSKKISIVSLEGRFIDDLYIVVAKAATPDGRIDQASGAVSIGNLKGEQKANAIMKAETKAKRRVTLSISGMGWTDESELESIPNATCVDVDLETGEIKKNGTLVAPQVHQTITYQPPVADIEPQKQPPAPPATNDPAKDIPHPEYNNFCAKHGIISNSDGTDTQIYKFVKFSAQKAKMSEVKVINYAIANEADFLQKFTSWNAKNVM